MTIRYLLFVFMLIGAALPAQTTQIQGRISTPTGLGICEASVQLWDQNNQLLDLTVTDASGHFSFVPLAASQSYRISAFKNQVPAHAYSVIDMILMTSHILGIQAFDDPFAVRAADLNGSATITTFDIVRLKRHLQQIDPIAPNNTWRFFTPDNSPLPLVLEPSSDNTNIQLIGLCIGDPSFSAKACE